MTKPLLAAHFLSVAIGGAVLIDDINLDFEAGQCTAIIGPNGAGKTTLLRAMSGDIRPRTGHVMLRGQKLSQMKARQVAARRAVLSQSFNVAFPFRVHEIVRLGAGDRAGAPIERMVEEKLAEVDMLAFADRVITTLSGGEQQRAHFARVLMQLTLGEREHGPGILMLDEPTSSLDLRHQIGLLTAARRYAAEGTLVVAVLHDLNLAATFAERLVVMHRGRVVEDGAPAGVITDDLLRRIYQVELTVGQPPAGQPFVLPQTAFGHPLRGTT